MKKLLKLISNENMKVYGRPSTVVMISLLAVMVVLLAVVNKIYIVASVSQNLWDGILDQAWLVLIVNIFTLVIAGGIVANEFSWGTVKLLLIRPSSRSKVLLSKYLVVIIFSLLLMFILFGLSFVTNLLIYGWPESGNSYLLGNAGSKALFNSSFRGVLLTYGFKYLEVFIYATMAFMLSSVSRSSALAIGLTLITMFVGPQINDLLSDYPWSRLLLFANTDLLQYVGADSQSLQGTSLKFSLMVLTVYYGLFNLFAWVFFTKRDITI